MKIRSLILVLLLAMLSGCTFQMGFAAPETTGPAVVEPPQEKTCQAFVYKSTESPQGLGIKSELPITNLPAPYQDTSRPQTLTVTILGVSCQGTYVDSMQDGRMGAVHAYRCDDGFSFELNDQSLVVGIRRGKDYTPEQTYDTQEEYLAAAQQIAGSFLNLDKYQMTAEFPREGSEDSEAVTVYFTRYVSGVRTEEWARVVFMDHSLYLFDVLYLELMDHAPELSQDFLDKAKQAATERVEKILEEKKDRFLSAEYEMGEPIMVYTADGRFGVTYEVQVQMLQDNTDEEIYRSDAFVLIVFP